MVDLYTDSRSAKTQVKQEIPPENATTIDHRRFVFVSQFGKQKI